MTTSGCVLPSPLHPAEQPDNFAPSLFKAVPAFGPLVQSNAAFDLQVFAEDANLDDTLRVRLFLGRTYTSFISEVLLVSTDNPDNPYERTGHLPQAPYCTLPGAGPGDYVVTVADRAFSMTPGMLNKAPGGKTAENYWSLSCNGMSQ